MCRLNVQSVMTDSTGDEATREAIMEAGEAHGEGCHPGRGDCRTTCVLQYEACDLECVFEHRGIHSDS